MNKDVLAFMKEIVAANPDVTFKEGGKHILVLRNGKFLSTLSRTPSDKRWRENAKKQLTRGGLSFPTERQIAEEKRGMAEVATNTRLDAVRAKVEKAYEELGGAEQRGVRTEFSRYAFEEVASKEIGGQTWASKESAYQAIHALMLHKHITNWAADLIERAADSLIVKAAVPDAVPAEWHEPPAEVEPVAEPQPVRKKHLSKGQLRKELNEILEELMEFKGVHRTKMRPFGVGPLGWLAGFWQQTAHEQGRQLHDEDKLSNTTAVTSRLASFAKGKYDPGREITEDVRMLVEAYREQREQQGTALLARKYKYKTRKAAPKPKPKPKPRGDNREHDADHDLHHQRQHHGGGAAQQREDAAGADGGHAGEGDGQRCRRPCRDRAGATAGGGRQSSAIAFADLQGRRAPMRRGPSALKGGNDPRLVLP